MQVWIARHKHKDSVGDELVEVYRKDPSVVSFPDSEIVIYDGRPWFKLPPDEFEQEFGLLIEPGEKVKTELYFRGDRDFDRLVYEYVQRKTNPGIKTLSEVAAEMALDWQDELEKKHQSPDSPLANNPCHNCRATTNITCSHCRHSPGGG